MVFKDETGAEVYTLFNGENYEMTAAEIDPQTGKTITPTESELIATITKGQANQLLNISSVDLSVVLNTEDAKRHRMFSDYTIKANLITDFIYENSL